jgi:hypothetical protein
VPDDYEFSRVLQLAVDAWRYGQRDARQQFELQRHLNEAVSVAATRSGLDRAAWRIQEQGDGLLGLIPDSGVEPVLVDAFVRELETWLSRHNHDRIPAARLRLRVAIHHGPAIHADLGYASDGVVHVCRLRDSRPVRAALEAAPEANLVQVVSERIFEDVIRQRHTSLSAADFVRAEIADEAKGFHATAWLRVPGVSPERVVSQDEAVALGLRFLTRDRAAVVERVLLTSFAKAGITPPHEVSPTDEDVVICLRGVSVQVVLGIWLDHLETLLASAAPGTRVVVGVCPAPDQESASRAARELTSMDMVAGALDAARDSRVAVVVPDDVYRRIAAKSGRAVKPDDYGPADAATWVRVLGYSKPPRPVEHVREEPAAGPAPGPGAVNAHGNNSVAIGTGTFHEFVVGTVNRYDGRR